MSFGEVTRVRLRGHMTVMVVRRQMDHIIEKLRYASRGIMVHSSQSPGSPVV